MITDILTQAIKQALEALGMPYADIHLEHPADLSHGDYSTNIALVLSKQVGKNPREIAEALVHKLQENSPSGVQKIDVAGPGFINFYLTDAFFVSELGTLLNQGSSYGYNEINKGNHILVEHSSPNLFKPFHIGHMMNNTIGESIARLMMASGAEVTKLSYPSDISLGIAKAVWACLQKGGVSLLDDTRSTQEWLALFGEWYVEGNKAFEADESIQKAVRDIYTEIVNNPDSDAFKVYTAGKTINLDYFKDITACLGSSFDRFFYESEAGVEGEKIVRAQRGDVFRESEGAVIYEGEQDGLHTRVFINKEGYPTYEAKDIGLLSLKFSTYNPDLSVLVTDHEQKEYYKVVLSAASKIDPSWKEKSVHLTHGRMTLRGAKMSSRLGGVPLAEDMLTLVTEEIQKRGDDITREEAEMIALSALKYSILKNAPGKNVDFDPDSATSIQGDSGPYIQYATVRAKAVLGKTERQASLDNAEAPHELVKKLVRFPEVVEQAVREYAPQLIVNYITEIASLWNSYYAENKIIGDPHEPYRLALAESVATVLTNGLYLLGIKTPERM